jgi:hypothetical protein
VSKEQRVYIATTNKVSRAGRANRPAGNYAVIDFDAVVRDPQSLTELLAQYASSDNIDPNGSGYEAIAKAIDLRFCAPVKGG